MTLTHKLLWVGASWLVLASALGQSQPYWIDITDPNELRALHSNKTHQNVGLNRATGYYRSDGKALLLQGG